MALCFLSPLLEAKGGREGGGGGGGRERDIVRLVLPDGSVSLYHLTEGVVNQ